LEVDEIFGLVVMDRKEATIGMLEGKRIEVFQKMTSGIPSKVKAGGQSAQRFHRITEGLTRDFYKRISAEIKKIFFQNTKLKGILVGGPIPTKDEFLEGGYLTDQLQKKVLARIDLGDSSESGLKELVEKSGSILAEQEIMQEKKEVENYFNHLGKNPKKTFLGEKDSRRALEAGAADILFLSTNISKTLSKELMTIAKNMGTKIKIISIETEEGDQFFNMGGIGTILRFEI